MGFCSPLTCLTSISMLQLTCTMRISLKIATYVLSLVLCLVSTSTTALLSWGHIRPSTRTHSPALELTAPALELTAPALEVTVPALELTQIVLS